MIARLPPIFFLALLLLPIPSWAHAYIYPARVELDESCRLDRETLSGIKHTAIPNRELRAKTKSTLVDLNADGVCEVFLTTPDIYAAKPISTMRLFVQQNGVYRSSKAHTWRTPNWWFGGPHNHYPQIVVSDSVKNRCASNHVTQVYYFDGVGYVKEAASGVSHGELVKLGKKAFGENDLVAAERHYLNAFRSCHESDLQDASNLALVWIALGRADEARQLVQERLDAEPKRRSETRWRFNTDLADAYFTLGLAAEARSELKQALEYFEWSYMEVRNHKRKAKLDEIRKRLGVRSRNTLFKCRSKTGEISYTDKKEACSNR